jgi:hypothetical protein
MDQNAYVRWIASFVILLSTAGCTAERDLSSNLPPTERATLKGGDPVRLMRVDSNRPQGAFGFGSTWDASYVVYLSPGKHSLGLQCWYQPAGLFIADVLPGQTGTHFLGCNEVTLQFEADANHVYSLLW